MENSEDFYKLFWLKFLSVFKFFFFPSILFPQQVSLC